MNIFELEKNLLSIRAGTVNLSRPETPPVIASGEGQKRAAGTALDSPLKVGVHDAFKNPIPGAVVKWDFVIGKGMLSANEDKANDKGIAEVSVILDKSPGKNVIRAAVPGTKVATQFTATGL